MDRRKSATLFSGTGFEHGKLLHASRAVGASHIGPVPRRGLGIRKIKALSESRRAPFGGALSVSAARAMAPPDRCLWGVR